MPSTKQLLKQLESLSKPRNLEEAKVYLTLAQHYSNRYHTDSFDDHFEAASGMMSDIEMEAKRTRWKAMVDEKYCQLVKKYSKLGRSPARVKHLAWLMLEESIEQSVLNGCHSTEDGLEHMLLTKYAVHKYCPHI